jgi:TDG/mug DNA glycosylase family protein
MDKPLPDVIAPDLAVLFCGLNPGLAAAAASHHFVGRGNRFWQVLHLAGFTPEKMRPEDDLALLQHGCGLTTVVARPTAGAGDLTRAEYVAAAADLSRLVDRFRPRCVAFLGKAAYAAIRGRRELSWGQQSECFSGAGAWLLPNPSGRNLNYGLADLVAAYRELRLSKFCSAL